MPSLGSGSNDVPGRLAAAAGELMSEVGPKAMSVRDVARRAEVNHGQVHHYFGGKPGLIQAAYAALYEGHAAAVERQSGGELLPPFLATGGDDLFLRATVRLVLDGELEVVAAELAGRDLPASRIVRLMTEARGLDEPTLDIAAAVAAGVALEFGWAVLEPLVELIAGLEPDETEALRARVGRIARSTERALDPPTP